MPDEQFLAWGWRIPFIASILLIGVALFIRLKIDETPAFQELAKSGEVSKSPLRDLLREQRKPVAIVMGSQVAQSGVSYIYQTFVITYVVTSLAMTSSVGPLGVACAAAVAVVTTPLFGMLSDRVGRKPVYLFGAAFSAVFAFPFFALVDSRSELAVIVAMVLGIGIGIASMLGAQGAFFSELFSSKVRFSGLVFGREISAAVSGGFAPLIAVALSAAAGGASWPVALLTIGLSAITFVALIYAPETRHIDIEAVKHGINDGGAATCPNAEQRQSGDRDTSSSGAGSS